MRRFKFSVIQPKNGVRRWLPVFSMLEFLHERFGTKSKQESATHFIGESHYPHWVFDNDPYGTVFFGVNDEAVATEFYLCFGDVGPEWRCECVATFI